MEFTGSAFKVPMAPSQPQLSQTEILLFNDIIEEKVVALRNQLADFLQVEPYRKFDAEFAYFMKRTRRIIQESHRAGHNVSRLANSSQITLAPTRPSTSFNYRPATSFNYRPSATTTTIVNSNRNSTFRLPENSFQPIENINPFKPPGNINLKPRVVLPRLEHLSYTSHGSPNLCATVIEESEVVNETAQTNNENENCQPPEPVEVPQSSAPNSYSNVTVIDNNITVSGPPQNENIHDGSNSIESLLDGVGFKIVVGLPDNSKNTKKSNASKNNNQLNVEEHGEKYLSMWSVNMKVTKSQSLKTSKAVLILTGNLLGEDRVTVQEKRHDAGVLESRKDKNLVKTNNGIYRLVGNIIGGSPNELYHACLAINGIPRTWRTLLKQLSGVEKGIKNVLLNFSLDSPAGPLKSTKSTVNLDMSMTRKGTTYSRNTNFAIQKPNGKRKRAECDMTENSKSIKQRRFHEQLPPLLASTPKRPKNQPTIFETPSQMLKNKIYKKIVKVNTKSNDRVLNTLSDSISIAKKRQSYSKEQVAQILKQKTILKTSEISNNSTKHSKQIGNSAVGSIVNNSEHSQQQSKNSNSNIFNGIKAENSSAMINSTRQQHKLKSPINSTKNSLNSTKKKNRIINTRQMTPEKVLERVPAVNVKAKKQQNISNRKSSSKIVQSKNNSKTAKPKAAVKRKPENFSRRLSNTAVPKEKKKKIKKKQEQSPTATAGGKGLFDDIDVADYGDMSNFNIMASPSKLSVLSHNDKSRSETPPLFNSHWGSTAKSLVTSEPPTPLSKSAEAKALKRVKAPKITLAEDIKNNKGKTNKRPMDYKAVSDQINKMLEFGEQYADSD